MAFIQQQRPRSSHQKSYDSTKPTAPYPKSSLQPRQSLAQSEEWLLFSPHAGARAHTSLTERTPFTTSLSQFSELGSLHTTIQSNQDDDLATFLGTEEELDSLDDGLHAFHEPSEHGVSASDMQAAGDTVLPTHDGLGEFQPGSNVQEHLWQFERPRKRTLRRLSSVQRHLTLLADIDNSNLEQERRQRIEKWRLEQSKALLEEIERETQRRLRMSRASSVRDPSQSAQLDAINMTSGPSPSAWDVESDSAEGSDQDLPIWQWITQSVIRDLLGLDEDTLSVIFGEALPEETAARQSVSSYEHLVDKTLQEAAIGPSSVPEEKWQKKVLARIAHELGILVHQLSACPDTFSTYQRAQIAPEHVDLVATGLETPRALDNATAPLASSPSIAHLSISSQFAPTFPILTHACDEASPWSIEEKSSRFNSTSTLRNHPAATATAAAAAAAQDLAREREYWEQELDIKIVYNFLMDRFSSRRSDAPFPDSFSERTVFGAPSTMISDDNVVSARRAAIIRQHHPLVKEWTDKRTRQICYTQRDALTDQKLGIASGCASQSAKKSRRSSGSGRKFWHVGGSVSVGSGSIVAGEC